jgi:hypothetical protein
MVLDDVARRKHNADHAYHVLLEAAGSWKQREAAGSCWGAAFRCAIDMGIAADAYKRDRCDLFHIRLSFANDPLSQPRSWKTSPSAPGAVIE